MKLSDRFTSITKNGDDGWGLFYKSRQLIAQGEDICELTIGEHDVRTADIILDEMHRTARAGHTGYPMVPGTAPLRDAVAARVETRTGVKTARENVLITPGGQAALFAAHLAVCNDGDKALYVDPYYTTYPGTIRSAGAVDVPVQTHAENSFKPTYDDIAAKADGAVSLLVNSPNNPTGVVYGREAFEAIARAANDYDLWLISDEVYDTQVWEGAHVSPRSIDGMKERTMVVGSMSKSHAMTGSRLGWIIAEPEIVEHLVNLATHTTYGVAGFIQDAGCFALAQGTALEQEIAAPFRRRRELVQRLIETQNVVRMVPSGGAMYVMLDIRATGLSGEKFGYKLLEQHKIAVMPGESFGQAASGHIRVAMTIDDERFTAALMTVLNFAAELASN